MLITNAVVAAANVAMYACVSAWRGFQTNISTKIPWNYVVMLITVFLSAFLSYCLFLCLFVCLSISSVCLSVCHSVCLCVCLSVCVCLSAHVKLISSCDACTVYDSAKSRFHSQHLKVKIFFRAFINMGVFETMLQDRLVHALFDAV